MRLCVYWAQESCLKESFQEKLTAPSSLPDSAAGVCWPQIGISATLRRQRAANLYVMIGQIHRLLELGGPMERTQYRPSGGLRLRKGLEPLLAGASQDALIISGAEVTFKFLYGRWSVCGSCVCLEAVTTVTVWTSMSRIHISLSKNRHLPGRTKTPAHSIATLGQGSGLPRLFAGLYD